MKFHDVAIQEKIRSLGSPMGAAIEGRSRANPIRPDWEQVMEEVMMTCLRAKFEQHPTLKTLLISTYPRTLAELSFKDDYWGTRPDGSGRNRLGHLLMHYRQELITFGV